MKEKLLNATKIILDHPISALPDEVLLLESEIKSKFPNSVQVTQIIESNSALATDVLRLVNSPIIKPRTPVKSIREAVNVLGLDNIYNIVVSSALRKLFGTKGVYREMMKHSVSVAFCMAELAEKGGLVTRDEAFLLGLFHNVGALVLANQDKAVYEPLFKNSMSLPLSIIAKEDEVYHTDHALIGVVIAKRWHLPTDLLNAIMFHHIEACESIHNDRVRTFVAMIKVANGLVAEHLLGSYRGSQMRDYELDGLQQLNLSEKALKQIRSAVMSFSFNG